MDGRRIATSEEPPEAAGKSEGETADTDNMAVDAGQEISKAADNPPVPSMTFPKSADHWPTGQDNCRFRCAPQAMAIKGLITGRISMRDQVRSIRRSRSRTTMAMASSHRPLHISALYGQVDLVRLLLDHGAYAKCMDRRDYTPLQLACRCGYVDVVELMFDLKEERGVMVDRFEALAVARLGLNGDGLVNGADVGIFLALWGTSNPLADLDGDGIVRASDLGILLSAWGPCP